MDNHNEMDRSNVDQMSFTEQPQTTQDRPKNMEDVRESAYVYTNPYSHNVTLTLDQRTETDVTVDRFYMPNQRQDPHYAFGLMLDYEDSRQFKEFTSLPKQQIQHLSQMYSRGNVHTSHNEKEENCDEMMDNKSYFNTYEYANRDLGIREVRYTKKPSGGMSDKDIFNAFKSALGGSRVVNVPLYHSGFRLHLTAPTVAELTALQLQCVTEEVEIGRDTFCLSSNGRRSLTVETFKNFIASKIKSSTLDIDMEKEDIFKYISMNDLDTILLGLVQATYINKIPVTRTCVNATDVDKMCDFSITADLDPSKLLNVDRRFMDFEMVKTIGKSEPKSVSLAEQQNYVFILNKAIDKIRNREKDIKFQCGIFELQVPSIADYCEDCSEWVEKVTKEIDELLDKSTAVSRKTALDSLTTASNVTSYIANIKSLGIVSEDGEVVKTSTDSRKELINTVESISTNDEINRELPYKIIEYINKSSISIVATPNFVCPKCKKDQEPIVSTKTDFDAFIPLNMIDFFLRLVEWQRVRTMIHTKD